MDTVFRSRNHTNLLYEIPKYCRCMAFITPSPDFKSSSNLTMEIIENYGMKDKKTLQVLVSMPSLTSVNPDTWKKILDVLITHGFSAMNVVDMAIRHPNLLKSSPQKLLQTWNTWAEILNQRSSARSLVMEHPVFLSLSKGDIISRCEQLRAVTGSYKFVANILSRCPQIMFQSLSELEQVTDYISTKMVVRNVAEYYNSTALGCTLEEVKTRHEFLVRCGKYVTPNLKQSEKVPTGNASLTEIFDTSEEEFATRIAGVTLEEFVVFQTMYEEELRQRAGDLEGSETDDTDYDTDSDSDLDSKNK